MKRLKKYKKQEFNSPESKGGVKKALSELVEVSEENLKIKAYVYNIDGSYFNIVSVRKNNTTYKNFRYLKKYFPLIGEMFSMNTCKEKYGVKM